MVDGFPKNIPDRDYFCRKKAKKTKIGQKQQFFKANIYAASQPFMPCNPPIYCRKAYLKPLF
jgi:hypothetical protein